MDMGIQTLVIINCHHRAKSFRAYFVVSTSLIFADVIKIILVQGELDFDIFTLF